MQTIASLSIVVKLLPQLPMFYIQLYFLCQSFTSSASGTSSGSQWTRCWVNQASYAQGYRKGLQTGFDSSSDINILSRYMGIIQKNAILLKTQKSHPFLHSNNRVVEPPPYTGCKPIDVQKFFENNVRFQFNFFRFDTGIMLSSSTGTFSGIKIKNRPNFTQFFYIFF